MKEGVFKNSSLTTLQTVRKICYLHIYLEQWKKCPTSMKAFPEKYNILLYQNYLQEKTENVHWIDEP